MKRWITKLLLLLILYPLLPIGASSFSTTLQTSVTIYAGQSFVLQVSVNDVRNLYSYEADIEYDASKIMITKNDFKTGEFDVSVGSRLVVDYITSQNGNFLIAEIPFVATDNFLPGETTVIHLSKVSGSDGENDVAGFGASITITISEHASNNSFLSQITMDGQPVKNFSSPILAVDAGTTEKSTITILATAIDPKANITGTGTKNLNYGTQSFPITVTAQDGSLSVYTVQIERLDVRSSNNYLQSIEMNVGSFDFKKEQLQYEVIVDYEVSRIKLIVVPEDVRSTVETVMEKELSVYDNRISVPVTAENGLKRIYSVNVIRRDEQGNIRDYSMINNLSSLEVEGAFLDFKYDVLEYRIQVDNRVSSLTIFALAQNPYASIIFDGHTRLKEGINVVSITVSSNEGMDKVYTIMVDRKSETDIITFETLISYLTDSSLPVLSVQLEDQYILDEELIKFIYSSGKTVYFYKSANNRVLYGWYIDGRELHSIKQLDLFVDLNPVDKLRILEKAEFTPMVFAFPRQRSDFPQNTRFQLNVESVFDSENPLYLYQYSTNEFLLIKDNLYVRSNMIEFDLQSSYRLIVTNRLLNSNRFSSWGVYVLILEGILIVLLSLYLVYAYDQKRKRLRKKMNQANQFEL